LTEKYLLRLVDLLLMSVPLSCKEEVRTGILVLGVELLQKNADDDLIFISLRNKKYDILRSTKRRIDLMTAGEYQEDLAYDKTLYSIRSKPHHLKDTDDRATKEDHAFVKEKYEVLFTAFVNMNDKRQRFIYLLLREHWRLTKKDPRKKVIITDIIKQCGMNPRNGLRLWKRIKEDIKKVYNEGRVNYLDRIGDFETLYNLIVGRGGRIKMDSRRWDNEL